jgi:hypothetical protein
MVQTVLPNDAVYYRWIRTYSNDIGAFSSIHVNISQTGGNCSNMIVTVLSNCGADLYDFCHVGQSCILYHLAPIQSTDNTI